MYDLKLLGENIRFYREAKGLSMELLAEHVGISYVYLSCIERGTRKVTSNILINILKSLNITYTELLNKSISAESLLIKDIFNLLHDSNFSDTDKAFVLDILKSINKRCTYND